MKKENLKPLTESLSELLQEANQKPILFSHLIEKLKGRGAPVFLIMLNIPFCLPVSIPGISTPFGLLIALIGGRMALGKHPYWPKSILKREISYATLKRIVTATLKGLAWGKRVLRPRLLAVSQSFLLHRLNGVLIMVLGLLLSLPLPIPFTNYFSAAPLIFLALGLLEDDGLFILLAYFLGFLSLLFWGALFFFGTEGLSWIFKSA